METTKEERAAEYTEAEKVLAMDDPAFPPAVRARQNAHADYLMRLCRDVDGLVPIVERLAELPCVCHPANKAKGGACLGDSARELLGLDTPSS